MSSNWTWAAPWCCVHEYYIQGEQKSPVRVSCPTKHAQLCAKHSFHLCTGYQWIARMTLAAHTTLFLTYQQALIISLKYRFLGIFRIANIEYSPIQANKLVR